MQGYTRQSGHLTKENPMSVLKLFFDIEQFETRTKKFVHFHTDGVSVSILLGEESKPNQELVNPRGKGERKMNCQLCLCQAMRWGLD
jgi:hypothetical protein